MEKDKENANTWIQVVKNEEIQSRIRCTNETIINSILSLKPNRVVDIGCGEGWLCRALENNNINTIGIDVSEALIAQAKSQSVGHSLCV